MRNFEGSLARRDDVIRLINERVTYKPQWKLKAESWADFDVKIRFRYAAFDANLTPEQVEEALRLSQAGQYWRRDSVETIIEGSFLVPPFFLDPQQPMNEEMNREVMRWLMFEIGKVEMHECDEWLKLDGKRFRNPHAEERHG